MDTLQSVLEAVRAGQSRFGPVSTSPEDMRSFQPTAKALIFALNEGYLSDCFPHRSAATGEWLFDLIVVSGGLTYEGEQFLASPRVRESPVPVDVIEVRPNLWGVGVNVNELWRRMWRKK